MNNTVNRYPDLTAMQELLVRGLEEKFCAALLSPEKVVASEHLKAAREMAREVGIEKFMKFGVVLQEHGLWKGKMLPIVIYKQRMMVEKFTARGAVWES